MTTNNWNKELLLLLSDCNNAKCCIIMLNDLCWLEIQLVWMNLLYVLAQDAIILFNSVNKIHISHSCN